MQLAQNAVRAHTRTGDEIALGCGRRGRRGALLGARHGDRDRAGRSGDDLRALRATRGQEPRTAASGLGLSIVRAIAEAHGGRVELRSDLGEGALFTIVVPVDGPPHPRRKAT